MLPKEKRAYEPALPLAIILSGDYSPELVALRTGAETGARLRFIDLTYPEQIVAEYHTPDEENGTRPRSLLDEHHLKHSAYLAALARRTGCRDQDDLWDHLFESSFLSTPTDEFIRRVAAYCYMARASYTPDSSPKTHQCRDHRGGGITRRLQSLGRRTARRSSYRGFHTAALLPDRGRPSLARRAFTPKKMTPDCPSYASTTRPSQRYASGLPHLILPQLWALADAHDAEPALGRRPLLFQVAYARASSTSRLKSPPPMRAPALEQALILAEFRRHAIGPTREELLDGDRSCFVVRGRWTRKACV